MLLATSWCTVYSVQEQLARHSPTFASHVRVCGTPYFPHATVYASATPSDEVVDWKTSRGPRKGYGERWRHALRTLVYSHFYPVRLSAPGLFIRRFLFSEPSLCYPPDTVIHFAKLQTGRRFILLRFSSLSHIQILLLFSKYSNYTERRYKREIFYPNRD